MLFLLPHRKAFTPAKLCYFSFTIIQSLLCFFIMILVQFKINIFFWFFRFNVLYLLYHLFVGRLRYNNSFTQAIRQLFVFRIITCTFYMEKNCAIVVLYVYVCILKLLFSYYTFNSIFLNKAINSSNSIFHFLSIIKNSYKAYSIENH